MNALDLLVVVSAALAAVAGYRLGFVTRVLSWLGAAAGLVVGVRLLPWLLESLVGASHAVIVVVAVGLVLATTLVGQAFGYLVAVRLRPRPDAGRAVTFDGALGAVTGVIGVLAIVWLLLPVLTGTPGGVADQASSSWVAHQLEDHLPQPPNGTDALRALVGEDRFPEVFAELRPDATAATPPADSGLDTATADRVARSVVKVESAACDKVQDGTGFVVADGLVLTNAHVVAGASRTDVIREDGTRLRADVVRLDPDADLALLRASRLDRPALPLGEGRPGDRGGVFGHPGGAPLRIAPFEIARPIDATGRDIYGSRLVERAVLELGASLRPGDSGSPLVDPAGDVLGVVFAIDRDRPAVAYALATSEVQPLLATPVDAPVDTGACLP